MAQSNAFRPSLGKELFSILGDVLFPTKRKIERYEASYIRKTNDVTRKTRELIDTAELMDPRELPKVIGVFRKMLPLVDQSVDNVDQLDDEHLEFKNSIVDFRNTFNELLNTLEYEAEKHEFSALSVSALAEAWESSEDEVWDSF